ncbi:hypothetical protein KAJ87_02850 [Candidatus Pacearchaeota archaeon]|nr:hypothetical protein [Candidatus Pacearchaeota archaeon]
MVFKINISEKTGKTFHLEAEAEELLEKELHNKIQGKDVSLDLEGYEFEITGASDNAGFTSMANVEGIGLKKLLLSYEKAMKKKPRKEGKKKYSTSKPKGLRLRKTVRGKVISPAIVQINLKVLKQGNKKLAEIFPDQCKAKVEEKPAEEKPTEQAPEKEEALKTEVKPEEKTEK